MQTVRNPQRMAFPGIYKNPKDIAAEAAARVEPEDPSLKRLFGVTRDDLYQMGKGRVGNVSGALPGAAAKPKGATRVPQYADLYVKAKSKTVSTLLKKLAAVRCDWEPT